MTGRSGIWSNARSDLVDETARRRYDPSKGAVRKENRLCLMIFFAALDLGRPPSKVLGGSSGAWSECTIRRPQPEKEKRKTPRGGTDRAQAHREDITETARSVTHQT